MYSHMHVATQQSRFQFAREESFFANLRQGTINEAICARRDDLLKAFQARPGRLQELHHMSCLPARKNRRSGTKNQGHNADTLNREDMYCGTGLSRLKAKSNHL